MDWIVYIVLILGTILLNYGLYKYLSKKQKNDIKELSKKQEEQLQKDYISKVKYYDDRLRETIEKIRQEEEKYRERYQQEKQKLDTNLAIAREKMRSYETEVRAQIDSQTEAIYNQNLENKELQFRIKERELKEIFKEKTKELDDEYEYVINEFIESYSSQVIEMEENSRQLESSVENLKTIEQEAIRAAKRKEEIKNERDFYRLVLEQDELEDVSNLKSIERVLHNKEVLNKIIYKVFYEKPYTAMAGRVLGPKTKTGIYKITNLKNEMCYVGQAVNIRERWRQHIKRALGAETPTQNKLYPAMGKEGVHNFSFEVVEECERSNLSEKESFWQDYYGAKSFGYSIK